MIHFGGRVYDPSIAQWLTPEWEHLVSRLKNPQDIFVYRFRGNDPISIDTEPRYMTSNIQISFIFKSNFRGNFILTNRLD
jgi:hypothetical protein